MKTNRENQANYAARKRAAGFTQRKIWAHPDDWPKIRKFISDLNNTREKIDKTA